MNRLILLLVIFFVGLVSCDGRDRAHKTNTEVLKTHKLLDSFSKKTIYEPEKYTEITTDTILKNGLSIHIKTYTSLEKTITDKQIIDTIEYTNHARDWISEVQIKKNDLIIFDEILDENFISKHSNAIKTLYPNLEELQVNSINIPTYVDEEMSLGHLNKVNLIYGFTNPFSKSLQSNLFSIIVDSKGHYYFEKLIFEKT